MPRGTRSRTPGRDELKRQLLASLSPADFPSLVADILYFSKGHRQIRIMDGPGDGCRDIQSADKDDIAVLTQCKCFEDPNKSVGSPDANELVVALTKFGRKRGFMATTGRFTPQLKREFTDNFPDLHLDWLDGADIIDEVFSNPLLFRAWVSKDTITRETVYVKIPFIVRRTTDDTTASMEDAVLSDWLTVESGQWIEVGSLERYRPPESVGWREAFGPAVGCAAVLSTSPPDLHALERLHAEVLEKLFEASTEVLIIRFGIPYLVPTKKPEFEKGMRVPGFSPRSYVVRPGRPVMPEHDFLLLESPKWRFPADLSVAEGDWGNWQTVDNQRWCHVEVSGPSFPNSTQSQICRMIGETARRELREARAVFATATRDDCERLVQDCAVAPDRRSPNGPGGELLGWFFKNKKERDAQRTTVIAAIERHGSVDTLDLEDAIHLTSRSDDPLVPSPAGEQYYPAQLVWDYADLPSPHYLKGRSCSFVEFWNIPTDLATAREELDRISFRLLNGCEIYVECNRGPKTKKIFAMFSVRVPWPIDRSTTEHVEEKSTLIDDVFVHIADTIRAVWPHAYCATSEFWETEVRFPAGAYIPTDKGLVRSSWWPEETEEGDD